MRITTVLLAATAAFATIPSTTAQGAKIDYEGTWVDHCAGGRATCLFTVEKTGRRYRMAWRATDRTGQQEHCRFSAEFVVATGKEVRKHLGPALVGAVRGGGAMFLTVDGDNAVLRTTGGACNSPVGMIDLDGSYDREYIDY